METRRALVRTPHMWGVVPKLGPWFLVYHAVGSGLMATLNRWEATVSASARGRGLILGLRWARPRWRAQRTRQREWRIVVRQQDAAS